MEWTSTSLSDESTEPIAKSDNGLSPKICIKIINLHVVFEIKSWPSYSEKGFTFLRNSLFVVVKLNKNPDLGYCISFNVWGFFHCRMVGLVRT